MPANDPPRRRHDPDETTERLLEAAAAEFRERGFDRAVVSDIARRAGLTTGAIYSRWPHKEDVMLAALDRMLSELLPAQRMEQFGIAELQVSQILELWAAYILEQDGTRESLGQIFGGAFNHPIIRERLQLFLEAQADQFASLVERSKEEGTYDPELSTRAMAMAIQAMGIGSQLLLSVGRSDRMTPSGQEWTETMARIIAGPAPR